MDPSELNHQTATDEIDLKRYTAFLGRWWRLIALCTILGGLIALGLGLLTPRVYQAESNLVIVRSGVLFNLTEDKVQAISDVGPGNATSLQDRRVSLLAIANSPEIATRVIEALGNQLAVSSREPGALQRHVRITGSGDLIQVEATSSDPNQAALMANAWADAYREMANTIYGDYSLSAQALQPQVESTKEDYDLAQQALVTFIAQDPSAYLETLIHNKQEVLSALQGSSQVTAQTVITKYQEAQTRLLVNYLDAIVNTRAKVISNQVGGRIQEFEDAYALKRKIQRILINAEALRKRLDTPGNRNLGGDQLAAMLLEASAFSSGADLPVTLQVPFNQVTEVPSGDQRQALDSFIQTLTTTETEVDAQIRLLAQQLIENKDYEYLTENAPQETSELQTAAATKASSLIRHEGLDALLADSTLDSALTTEVQKIQSEMSALEAELETAAAKRLELETDRDLARVTYETLAKTLAEARVAEQSKGGVLRQATRAVVPEDPVSQGTAASVLVGALIGLLAGVLLAAAAELGLAAVKSNPKRRTGVLPGLLYRISAWLGPGAG